MDEPTRWDWHPSTLAYAAIPNPQHDLDTITMTSEKKSTTETGTHLYDRSLKVRRYALAGLACSGIFSISCIIVGAYIMAIHGANGMVSFLYHGLPGEVPVVVLNLIVTLCTESTGFVHSTSLRFALASESRLRFNTNLRLLTAARGWTNPNGVLLNGVMAVLLILSYTSASLVIFFRSNNQFQYCISITGLPLFFLGVTLFLQVAVSLSGMRAVNILTWSSSPSDVTAALVHHMQLTPVPLRCMRGMSDVDVYGGPAKPSRTNPSAWHAHRSIRKVVLSLWGLVVAYAIWAVVATLTLTVIQREWESMSWSFFPTLWSAIVWPFPLYHLSVTVQWVLSYVAAALLQGPLTLGLHCSELITNVIRDERQWRRSTGRNGLKMMANPLKSFFTDPLALVLFVTKPALHWMFGMSFNLYLDDSQTITDEDLNRLPGLGLEMIVVQIWNLCIALFIFACFFTLVAFKLYRPRGPQPVTYGHLQTLANLVDEWSPVMWWGHKADGIPYCHAGTSDHPLPAVKMDCVYAGPSVGSHSSVSPLGRDLQTHTCQEYSSQKAIDRR